MRSGKITAMPGLDNMKKTVLYLVHSRLQCQRIYRSMMA